MSQTQSRPDIQPDSQPGTQPEHQAKPQPPESQPVARVALPLRATPGEDPFAQRLAADGQELKRASLTTLQLNLGKMCNLACHHCHVEAGPKRTEIMTWDVFERVLHWIDQHGESSGLAVADLTGGAPEMNPHFRDMVAALKQRGLHVLDRCNLTILLEEGYHDLADFLAEHQVEIVASLPCYLEGNVDKQRGNGVFRDSIEALQKLNAVGYGRGATAGAQSSNQSLKLDLVYNPVGYGLPGSQVDLEKAYKQHLDEHFGIQFDNLFTITNMPIKRFEHQLRRDGQLEPYMGKLIAAHNAGNVDAVMCRSLISVGWQGGVYDCDFNQMLQMPLDGPLFGDEHECEAQSAKLWDFTPAQLIDRTVLTGSHCFGCTAGAGSSCTGALG